jgi:hypothetical protein
VDAILLQDADLDAVRLLLEGHPLAETAVLVPGRDHHLLMAPGGVADRIPVGRYLTSAGPGDIYVAQGARTDPRLPAAAWRDLARDLGRRALVLDTDRTLVFDLSRRRPVWELWAGEPPAVDVQLPPEAGEVLAGLAAEERVAAERAAAATPQLPRPPATRPAVPAAPPERPAGLRGLLRRLSGRGPETRDRPLSWQEQAAAAEDAADLVAAARLHAQHGDHLRAARLYERAAYEGTTEGRSPDPRGS